MSSRDPESNRGPPGREPRDSTTELSRLLKVEHKWNDFKGTLVAHSIHASQKVPGEIRHTSESFGAATLGVL